ncbi:MAG: metallophosphoesterase [Opitutaceae bacterium]|nr:metallophosphoesterase [Opitutaceae bacterium]
MPRTLIIPDLHNKVRKAEFLLAKLKGQYDRVCFLGDYFDDFDDTPAHAERVARWLRESLDRPERIHLLGNHDLAYLVPGRLTACSGFTIEKRHVIAEVLADVPLSRFAIAVNIEGWLVSHAGFHRRFAEGKTPEELITMANGALKRLVRGVDEPLFGIGYAPPRIAGRGWHYVARF